MAVFQSLEIEGFRNLRAVRMVPHPRLNFIAGKNGAGKTAILEAIHYLVRGKSFRSVQPQELISAGDNQLLVRAGLTLEVSDSQQVDVAVLRERNKRQQIRWRGSPVRSFAKISSHVPLQIFLPNLSDLVFGGPGERRRWLDWGAFHVEHRYLDYWRRYSKCLQQRNALLRSPGGDQPVTHSPEFQSFSTAMVEAANAVTAIRETYLDRWQPFFERRLQQLISPNWSEHLPRLSLKPFGSSKSLSLQDLLGESALRELKSGVTIYGPHRADCELLIGIVAAASMASRGQGKLIALAMMIAQADVIADQTKVGSVFLMDDLDAELDQESKARLYQALADCKAQVFITGVRPGPEAEGAGLASTPASYAMFHVEHGSVIQETA